MLDRLAAAVRVGKATAKPRPLRLLTSPRRAVDPRIDICDLSVLSTPTASAADTLLGHYAIPVSLEPCYPRMEVTS
jgi:hypothetical protein